VRKTTLVMLGILLVAAFATTWAFKTYTDQVIEEVRNAKDWTAELRDELAPDAKIRLRRTEGRAGYVNASPETVGLLVEARPSAASWANDRSGMRLALALATKAFERYGPDRPIDWVEVKLTRLDGTILPSRGFERGDGMLVVPIDPAKANATR
jgi:hypothetical protein